MVELIPVCESNIKLYEMFERDYDNHLKRYLSRIYPRNHEQYADRIKHNLLFWNYIFVNQNNIGSVWLEKETPGDSSASLGIFINDESNQGKGIGVYVIKRCIKIGSALLDVKKVELRVRATNLRAYNCYKKCGFHETNSFVKEGNPKVIQMEISVNENGTK